MFLIQILLPVYTNKQETFPQNLFSKVRKELTEKYGGLTTYVRSPAVGLWKDNAQSTVRDDIIIYEVMTEEIESGWWKSYKEQLCTLFEQEEIVIRASQIQVL